VIPLIQAISGSTVQTIDPAPAIARQTQRLLAERGWLNPEKIQGQLHFFTSGVPTKLQALLPRLLGEIGPITQVNWIDHRLEKAV